jgi:hypothetical protein
MIAPESMVIRPVSVVQWRMSQDITNPTVSQCRIAESVSKTGSLLGTPSGRTKNRRLMVGIGKRMSL